MIALRTMTNEENARAYATVLAQVHAEEDDNDLMNLAGEREDKGLLVLFLVFAGAGLDWLDHLLEQVIVQKVAAELDAVAIRQACGLLGLNALPKLHRAAGASLMLVHFSVISSS